MNIKEKLLDLKAAERKAAHAIMDIENYLITGIEIESLENIKEILNECEALKVYLNLKEQIIKCIKNETPLEIITELYQRYINNAAYCAHGQVELASIVQLLLQREISDDKFYSIEECQIEVKKIFKWASINENTTDES